MDTQQPERVGNWRWEEVDLRLLLQQFRGLKVTQQYNQTQKQLAALGPEGQLPLARVQMEMLSKVVSDFLAQLSTQPATSTAAAETAMSQPEAGVESEGTQSRHKGKAGRAGRGGEGAGRGMKQGQWTAKGAVSGGEPAFLTSSQVKKKDGLQQKREQLKAGKLPGMSTQCQDQCKGITEQVSGSWLCV